MDQPQYDAEVISFELVLFNGSKKSAEMTEITCDQKKTSVQLFENHDPLSLVNSGQDNGDDTGGQAGSQGSLVLAEQVPGCAEGRALLSEVVFLEGLGTDQTLASVLGSSDSFLNKGGGLGNLFLGCRFLQALVDSLLVVGLGLAETVNTAGQSVVPGLAGVLVLSHCSLSLTT